MASCHVMIPSGGDLVTGRTKQPGTEPGRCMLQALTVAGMQDTMDRCTAEHRMQLIKVKSLLLILASGCFRLLATDLNLIKKPVRCHGRSGVHLFPTRMPNSDYQVPSSLAPLPECYTPLQSTLGAFTHYMVQYHFGSRTSLSSQKKS